MGERRVALHRRRGSTEADSGEQECAYPLQVGAHHDHDHDDGHGDDNIDEGHRAGLCLCLPSSGGLLHKRSQLHSCRYLKLQLIEPKHLISISFAYLLPPQCSRVVTGTCNHMFTGARRARTWDSQVHSNYLVRFPPQTSKKKQVGWQTWDSQVHTGQATQSLLTD